MNNVWILSVYFSELNRVVTFCIQSKEDALKIMEYLGVDEYRCSLQETTPLTFEEFKKGETL